MDVFLCSVIKKQTRQARTSKKKKKEKESSNSTQAQGQSHEPFLTASLSI